MPIYERGGGYQANFMLDGVRYRRTFKTRQQALEWSAKIRAEALTGPSHDHMTISDLIRHVEQEDWGQLRSGWRQVIKAKAFADFVGSDSPVAEALTGPNIEAFLSSREKDHRNSAATVNCYGAAISKVCKYAQQLGLIQQKPRIKKRRGASVRSVFFTRSQERALCAAVRRRGRPDLSNLFVWLAETGMRVGEALQLVWGDLDEQRRLITIPAHITKTDRPRSVGMSDRALAALQDCDRASKGPWSHITEPVIRKHWAKLRQEFPWMTEEHVPHTFRHTCASRLVQSGASLYQVQRWLGHSTITQTERYAKFAPENMRDMAGLLDRFQDVA